MLSLFDSLYSLKAGSAKYLKSIIIVSGVIRDSSPLAQNDQTNPLPKILISFAIIGSALKCNNAHNVKKYFRRLGITLFSCLLNLFRRRFLPVERRKWRDPLC